MNLIVPEGLPMRTTPEVLEDMRRRRPWITDKILRFLDWLVPKTACSWCEQPSILATHRWQRGDQIGFCSTWCAKHWEWNYNKDNQG